MITLFYSIPRYYGGTLSEKVLGKCLKALGVPRDQYIVATKCGRYKDGFDFGAERVTKSIDESLERLQLDYVDILHCHDIEFGSLDQVLYSVPRQFLSSSFLVGFYFLCLGLVLNMSTWRVADRERDHSCPSKD